MTRARFPSVPVNGIHEPGVCSLENAVISNGKQRTINELQIADLQSKETPSVPSLSNTVPGEHAHIGPK